MANAVATVGGGCFWCIEAAFSRVEGVVSAISGYAGGKSTNPTYEEVCSGQSGHAEVVQITFNQEILSYQQLLEIFFTIHDPTTLNRQGNDKGTQYRSVIYYHSEQQLQTANSVIAAQADKWPSAIVTEVAELPAFYPAETYHQNYYAQNPQQGYCRVVIAPKIAKLEHYHSSLLK